MSGLDVLLQTAVSIKKLNLLKQKQYEYFLERAEPQRLSPYKGTLKKNLVFGDYNRNNNINNPIHAIYEQSFERNYSKNSEEIDKKFSNVKNVSFVKPTFGNENAIVTVPSTKSILKQPAAKKVTDKDVLTETIEKIKQKEAIPVEKTDIVTQTTEILKVSEEQLEDVQKLIKEMKDLKERQKDLQQKQNERLERLTQKRRKKKKERKEIVSSIWQLNKTIERLHKEYLKAPRIAYKSVKDCFTQNNPLNKQSFTQSSRYDLIYENSKFPMVPKEDDTVSKMVKDDLSDNTTFGEDFKISSEPNYEYDDRKSMVETDSELRLLQAAERSIEEKLESIKSTKMQKFMAAHQKIRHVDEVCDKLDDILYNNLDDGEISCREERTDSGTQTNNNVPEKEKILYSKNQGKFRKNISAFTKLNLAGGDDSKVEKCLKHSCYLMKEMAGFQTRPKIRMLSDNGIISREILRVSDEAFDKQKESITTLMENLSVVMKSSFYSPDI